MTDTPGRAPEGHEPEQRLPAVRPETDVAPVERFTSAPSIRKLEFTPERAAQVVRQSANARWVGFLTVVVIILFTSIYWFYELGAPGGLTKARQAMEIDAQQVSKVERGYNIYEANCARCHGAKGEGGEGPTLNRQDKLFSHLSEAYIRNVLTVGGRYVCGNPASRMPIWSNQGNPPGPLNYRQIEELIAFLLATNDQTFIVRDDHLLDPKKDPITGQTLTFTGWRDPNYKPAPGATPFPDCWSDEFKNASGSSASPAASANPNAKVVEISASSSSAFDQTAVKAPADAAFVIHFSNKESGVPHNVEVIDAGGTSVAKGAIITGVAEASYDVPALKAGAYTFHCSVHPNMTGTLTAG
ncbi:MAG TPA: cupredoxin domain-containing protein [Candidatus Limnocylindrales bacterium]|jgi:mono/diheme cytochrome c family protein/plastocyanin|nr:cupredoxin domain-containing protein [Candidatus Limnocylindrales bacterium]